MNVAAPLAATPAAPRITPRRLAFALLAVVGLYGALAWLAGGAETAAAAARIGVGWIALGMLLTAGNFLLRGLRWDFLLRAAGWRVPRLPGFAIYLAGIGLTFTPGKLGETVRSAFLLRHGVPVGASLAAFFVDRLSDVIAVLLIALLPLALGAGGQDAQVARGAIALVGLLAATFLLRVFVRSRHWPRLVAALSARPRLQRLADWLARGGSAFGLLWRPRVALPSVAFSLLAYGLQASIFAGMVAQVAPGVSPWVCLSIFGAATLAGAASMVPGAIGAMELALVLLLRAQGVETPSAVAAALCLRAVTFWFGLVLGALGLGIAARQHHG